MNVQALVPHAVNARARNQSRRDWKRRDWIKLECGSTFHHECKHCNAHVERGSGVLCGVCAVECKMG